MKREDLIAPERYNIVMEVEKHAEKSDLTAISYRDDQGNSKEVTYGQLIENVNRVGNALLNSGLKRGDKVLVTVPRVLEAYEVYLACLKTGIVIIPSSDMLTTADLQYRITHSGANGVISYHPYVETFESLEQFDDLHKFVIGKEREGWSYLDDLKAEASTELEMADTSRDDIAFLPYTSGTTGNPKGVVHSHSWGYAHIRTLAENWLDIREGDKVWATAGPGWQKWVWSPFMATLGSGVTGFVYNGGFDAETYLNFLQNEEIDVLCCTPTEYRFMAQYEELDKFDLSHLRSALSAGEALNLEVIEIFQKHFDINVRDGYGQTENTLLLGIMKDMELRPGAMGKPTPGNVVEIIDEDGNILPPGEVGDIALRRDSPALFKEYYEDAERTEEAMRGDFYVTGDLASRDEDGYFWFEGRSDDIIISSGYTIGPFEVEDALIKHPAVKESAVVASPDDVRGAVVKAFIVARDGVDTENPDLIPELQDHVKKYTAPYKYPRRIEFIDELPRTISGKVRHVELRSREYAKYNNGSGNNLRK